MSRSKYLKQKLTFLKYAMVVFGLPAAFIAWLILGRYGDLNFQIFIIAFTLGCGLVWSLVIWHFFIHAKPLEDEENKEEGEQ